MIKNLRDFARLCKDNGFFFFDNGTKFYCRTFGDGLFQVISIYKQPNWRKIIKFGCYSMYGKIFYSVGGNQFFEPGTYNTHDFAKLYIMTPPTTFEEDLQFMETVGIPFLNNLKTQRDLLDAEAERGKLFQSGMLPSGLTPWNFNICGAHLYENEIDAAMERVALIMAQNLSAFLSVNEELLDSEPSEELAIALQKFVSERADVIQCYRVMISNKPPSISEYLDNWYQTNQKQIQLMMISHSL